MTDFFFLIRISIWTVIVVTLMQVKVGPLTLEQKGYQFLAESSYGLEVRRTAEAVYKTLQIGFSKFGSLVATESAEQISKANLPGYRLPDVKLERSQKYLQDLKEKIEDSAPPVLNE